MQVQLRKYKNNLVISGGAIILFEIWALAKVFLTVFIGTGTTGGVAVNDMMKNPTNYAEYQEALDAVSSVGIVALFIMVLLVIVLAILEIFFRIYVGRTAMRIGKGLLPSNRRYIVCAVILIIISLVSDAFSITQLTHSSINISNVMALVVEFTSLYALVDLVRSARKVHKYSKSLTE